jgi:3-oxoacyl-[acyl-carrier protein] reductase
MNSKPVALVTGGTRGIGRAIGQQLAAMGFDLVITHRGLNADGSVNPQAGLAAKAAIEAASARCELVRADVAARDSRSHVLTQMRKQFGRCDLLVNNAGIAPTVRTDILDATEDSYDHVMDTNLKGPYFLTQAVANWMIEQKRNDDAFAGRIVNISSISAYTASVARGEYCLSKAGMSMMTKLFAARLGEFGIGVFEIRPGIIATDMTSAVTEKYDALIANGLTPLRRWGQPTDIASAVAAIAAGQLDFATGTVLDVDGGFHVQRL